jgi:hypothetical protein
MGNQSDPFCYRLARALGCFFKRRTAIDYFTAVLALAAVAQAYYFMQSERSFLAVSGMMVSGLTTMSDKPLEFSVEIKNGGRSTAFIERMVITIETSSDELPDFPHYNYAGRRNIRGPVLAGGTFSGTFKPEGADLKPFVPTDAQISAIKIGATKLYIFNTAMSSAFLEIK